MFAIEPLLPDVAALELLALTLTREAAALGAALPEATRSAVAALLRTVNTYHSNLIEGHDTRPRDIVRAMASDYSTDPERRTLQIEARAHVEVQVLIERRLDAEPDLPIAGSEFLCWVHREFYDRMPRELRVVHSRTGGPDREVEPGALRAVDVDVGRHLPPPSSAVPAYLERFRDGYHPRRLRGVELIAAIPASHHRLLWIHPFLDGNGRVARLFSDAFLRRAELGSHGLWTASRGLARSRGRYLRLLEAADAERWNDYDGRGARSQRTLTEFCVFFLETCLDQVRYMRELLDVETLAGRLEAWVALQSGTAGMTRHRGRPAHGLPPAASRLLVEVLRRGEVARGGAARILGVHERTARRVVARCAAMGLLVSSTPKGPLRLAFPPDVAEFCFPLLVPA